MLKILLTILLFSLTVFAQSTYQLKAKCAAPYNRNYQSFVLQNNNVINSIACPDGYNLFNKPIVGRINYTDSILWGAGLDLQAHFDNTTALNPLVYIDYTIATGKATSETYKGIQNIITYNANSIAGSSSINGFSNSAILSSNVNVHDLQGFTSEAIISNGRAGSNINGGVFAVGVFNPATAQDVADLTAGVSTVNTAVRSYQTIWLKQPTLTSATFTGEANAIRLGSGTNYLFTVGIDGKTIGVTFSTPTSSTDTCRTGQIRVDTDFIYVCTSTNNYKRATLNAF